MQIILARDAKKDLKRLPKSEQSKVRKKVLILSSNPTAGKKLSGELEGLRSLRVWPYRIIYKINTVEHQIEVSGIIHRQRAYK